MTDKEKIRKGIKIVVNRRLNLLNGDYFDLNKEADGFTNEIMDIIYSLQEEPVSKDFEQALETEWRGYINRGAAKVDALEDNTQELAFAKGFYRAYQLYAPKPVSEELEEAALHYCNSGWREKEPLEAFKAGAKWQKEKIMTKAIGGVVTFDYYGDDDKTYGCIAHDSFCLEDFGLKDRDEVKVIVIKED